MSPYWYKSSHKAALEKKRKHRKRKGDAPRMNLKTLSKTISATWKNAPEDVVEYCKKLAVSELEEYRALVKKIKTQQKQLPALKLADGVAMPIKNCLIVQNMHDQAATGSADFTPSNNENFGNNTMMGAQEYSIEDANFSVNYASSCGVLKMLQDRLATRIGRHNDNASSSHPAAISPVSSTTTGAIKYYPATNTAGDIMLPSMVFGNQEPAQLEPLADVPQEKKFMKRRASAPILIDLTGADSTELFKRRKSYQEASSVSPVSTESEFSSLFKDNVSELSDSSHQISLHEDFSSFCVQEEAGSDSGSFTCVPEWKKQDADTLLDILRNIEPQHSIASGMFSEITMPNSTNGKYQELQKQNGVGFSMPMFCCPCD